ncbi:MAG: hypothetical protein ACT6Q9_09660 [Polaromonas sp.]|uniref:hypothetical protein n=1 Tax=Polaromonas sp. TaxID=1869339 RepID=UPI004035A599
MKSTTPHQQLVAEVLRKIGKNVLLFQNIEILLKAVLPFMPPSAANTAPADAPEMSQALKANRSLGTLREPLRKALKLEELAGFETYLNAVRNHRNELVHLFMLRPDSSLSTVEQCRSVISYLDNQHKFSIPLLDLANRLNEGLIDRLDESIAAELLLRDKLADE